MSRIFWLMFFFLFMLDTFEIVLLYMCYEVLFFCVYMCCEKRVYGTINS